MVKENFGSWTIIDLIINFPSKKKIKKNLLVCMEIIDERV